MYEDPLAPARGILIGLMAGATVWSGVAYVIWKVLN